MRTLPTLALSLAPAALAGLIVLCPHAHADPPSPCDAYTREVGDDNCDGRIDEDESGWDCHAMGNHLCGPLVSGPGIGTRLGTDPLEPGEYIPGTNPLDVIAPR